jgi:hypothetical protein
VERAQAEEIRDSSAVRCRTWEVMREERWACLRKAFSGVMVEARTAEKTVRIWVCEDN